MFPYPIPAYPTNPPPKWPGATVADCTFTMPECNVIVDGAELAARYQMGRSGECSLARHQDQMALGTTPSHGACLRPPSRALKMSAQRSSAAAPRGSNDTPRLP